MLICIFLLLGVIICCVLCGKINLIIWRFCCLIWQQFLWFSLLLLNLYCFIVRTRVLILLFIWIISWFWFILSMLAKMHNLFCAHYWFYLGLCIIISKSELYLTQWFFSLGLFWDRVDVLVSLQVINSLRDRTVISYCVAEAASYNLSGHVHLKQG